jgi:antirestriction protein ArdC
MEEGNPIMSTKTHTRTPEQRKAEAEALHQSIIDQVQQLADSGQWRRFLDFARSFHTYSLSNLLLILAQNSDATMVAGFRQWQAKGRQVRRGEKAIKIFGYAQAKARKESEEEDAEASASERNRIYFPVLSVFDISQTDPLEGAEPIPENPSQRLTGIDDAGILAPLIERLKHDGWTISRAPMQNANGYTDPDARTIVLASGLGSAQEAKTLLHEAAHIELRHTDDLDEYRNHRGRMEVEAESVAYIVAGIRGLDTSAYSIGYIAGWADQNAEMVRMSAQRVLAASQLIATQFEET